MGLKFWAIRAANSRNSSMPARSKFCENTKETKAKKKKRGGGGVALPFLLALELFDDSEVNTNDILSEADDFFFAVQLADACEGSTRLL